MYIQNLDVSFDSWIEFNRYPMANLPDVKSIKPEVFVKENNIDRKYDWQPKCFIEYIYWVL